MAFSYDEDVYGREQRMIEVTSRLQQRERSHYEQYLNILTGRDPNSIEVARTESAALEAEIEALRAERGKLQSVSKAKTDS